MGGARRHHQDVGLGAPVEQAVLEAAALDLHAERLAVERALVERVAELPVAADLVEVAGEGDVPAARGFEHLHLVVAAVLQAHDEVGAGPVLVARHLAADVGVAGQVLAVHGGGHGDQHGRIVVRHVGGVEALGILLGDQAGVEVAGDEARMLHQRRLEGKCCWPRRE